MSKDLLALVALTALSNVQHNGKTYGPGQPAGTNFSASEAEAKPLLDAQAVKLFDANDAGVDSSTLQRVSEATEQAQSALNAAYEAQEVARLDAAAAAEAQAKADEAARLAAEAQAKADTDAKAAAAAQAKADADALAVAEARTKLDADIKAFEAAQAAAAKKK